MDEFEIGQIICQRVSGPEAGLAITRDVPRQPRTRPEVVLVGLVQLVDSLTDADQPSQTGDEFRRDIVGLADRPVNVVAQPAADGDARRDLPIVVDERAEGRLP